MNWTGKDLKDKGIAQVNGTYKKLQPVKVARVNKLPNLLERAMPGVCEATENGGKVYIIPLSVNEAWKGRRFKSDEYKVYDNALSFLLPKDIVIPEGKLTITFEWGVSNDASDWDGPIKQTQDIIARRYKFDDKRIVRGTVTKTIVPKGQEFIKFSIEKLK